MTQLADIIAGELFTPRIDTAVWLGYGCGGFYRKVTANEALEALTEQKPDLPSLRIETKLHNDTAFICIIATWLENCICVVVVPESWDYSTGSPE